MPQPRAHVPTLRFRAGRIGRLFRRGSPRVVERQHQGVDARTRNFWAPDAPATLVEADTGTAVGRRTDRVASMIAAREAGAASPDRPRADPAFVEAVFVELMRASQYRRAFEQLSSECRRSWGSADAFAAAQGDGSMSRLRGVRVTEVRYLSEWIDPERGTTHQNVAELRVEYEMGGHEMATIARTIHLVAEGARWRSLCYPATNR
ncbi:MAG: hypothetical protein JOY80_11020 [Candidatus Dormibacteraeota bacterium]|nr:hypothetical protein [Candidatus Dormibacteraeota bacterium]